MTSFDELLGTPPGSETTDKNVLRLGTLAYLRKSSRFWIFAPPTT
jgi:hypothetical protein